MAGEERSRILRSRGPLQGRLAQIPELPDDASRQRQRHRVRHRERRKKKVPVNQAAHNAPGEQAQGPLDGLPGTHQGEQLVPPEGPAHIKGRHVSRKRQDKDEEDPKDPVRGLPDHDDVGHHQGDVKDAEDKLLDRENVESVLPDPGQVGHENDQDRKDDHGRQDAGIAGPGGKADRGGEDEPLPSLPWVPLPEGHAGVFLHTEEDNSQDQEEEKEFPAEQDLGEQDRHGHDRREPALQV